MKQDIENALRNAIMKSGITHYQLWRDSGVHHQAITRFVRRERTLRLDSAAKIAACLDLVLKQEKQ